jgi:hypothetical protein
VKFKFGDKVHTRWRNCIFIELADYQYNWKSEMSTVAFSNGEVKNVYTGNLKRGWKK